MAKYIRKFICGRALTLEQLSNEIIQNPSGHVFMRRPSWHQPVHNGFIKGMRFGQVAEYCMRGWICKAEVNPHHPKGGSHD